MSSAEIVVRFPDGTGRVIDPRDSTMFVVKQICPLCEGRAKPFRQVDGVNYFECDECEFLFADPHLLDQVDSGTAIRLYDQGYWKQEIDSARERAFGPSLARVAEAFLYARQPISRFLDIGTGPGYLLDALRQYLPHAAGKFFGVELFPPPREFRSSHPNYHIGDLASLKGMFQGGVCVEVLEHLTPAMARTLAFDLARVSDPQALYIFNTGLVSYVKAEDPQYLDPYGRGHITSWSVPSARRIFEPAGFSVSAIHGKTWAFAVEYQGRETQAMRDRIWTPHAENRRTLHDPEMGSVMYVLGIDAARAY